MPDARPRVRLRQAVIAAAQLEPVAQELRTSLGLGEPFRDPGVGMFGLVNTVFAISDCFIEVISPSQPDTAAGRWLERHGGDGGYMVIFDLEDLDGARARVRAAGVRVVWQLDLPDISGTHLHPADMRGAIVSLDRADPPGSWRWGGPDWTGRTGTGAPGRIDAVTVSVTDPAAVAERWGRVLGVEPDGGERPELGLDGGTVAFEPGGSDDGLTEVHVALPPDVRAGRDAVEVGGVLFRMRDA